MAFPLPAFGHEEPPVGGTIMDALVPKYDKG